MGTDYYAICHDCKEYIDLYKFWKWWPLSESYGDLENEDFEQYKKDDRWIFSSLRLHLFMIHHRGHRIGVYSEHFGEEVELGVGDPMFALLGTGIFDDEYQRVGCMDEVGKREEAEYREKKEAKRKREDEERQKTLNLLARGKGAEEC